MGDAIKSPFLSPDDAALSLNMNRKTLDNLRWDKKGPAYRKHGVKSATISMTWQHGQHQWIVDQARV